jgi:hypothetical protein
MKRSVVEWSCKVIHLTKQRVRNRRWWLKAGTWVVLIYTVLTTLLFVAMKQTPLRFAAVMAQLPLVSMYVLPFEPLWNIARRGDLRVGDPAPDFRLQSYEKSSWVELSSFRGARPVVLIFGSYT